ncbi:MAG: hypothetical protein GY748_10815 [Planctomycetaceae bacterium]|nr:hypothetical protein [Planctomycetaceae bacterium]
MLFTQLDEIQDVNGIQQFARKMHDEHDKNNMEPWDVIAKMQERIIKDRKYWEKEENVDTTPNSSFLANAPLTRTDNRGPPKRPRRGYLTQKPRWLQNHDPPHLVPGARRFPNGDWFVSHENINFLYCERCSAGPHRGLWNRTHTTIDHRDSIAPNRVRPIARNYGSRSEREYRPTDSSRSNITNDQPWKNRSSQAPRSQAPCNMQNNQNNNNNDNKNTAQFQKALFEQFNAFLKEKNKN